MEIIDEGGVNVVHVDKFAEPFMKLKFATKAYGV